MVYNDRSLSCHPSLPDGSPVESLQRTVEDTTPALGNVYPQHMDIGPIVVDPPPLVRGEAQLGPHQRKPVRP